ncbi:hypothetical protein FSP39_005302 [Pinctada imbricata]|uniref:Uncharacterized protein n=1 Tax=Pinctada imbricata TaxID=66713 RepID=A0AA88YKY7_PINIB|nr:hypothetical protein FSP39_005302 [Pinctada imbricata]
MSTGNVSKPTSADCLGINIKDGLWEWSTCNTALPGYVCKRPKTYFTGKPRKSCHLELHGMCYTVHSKKKSFEEAQAACKEPDIGGTLATITDAEQKNQISSRLKSNVQYYWILDGTDCKAIQKPRSAFGKNYISSRNCTEKHGFICSRVLPLSSLKQLRRPQNLQATAAPTISSTSDLPSNKTSNKSCGEGWIIYGKKCLKKLFHPWSWTTGRSHCFTIFADLASIHSKEENTFIVKTFPVNNFLWIGLRGSGSSWTDGSSVNFTSLSMTPTSNTTGCVAVTGDGTWTQRPCTKWYPVLCMRRIKESCGNVPAVDNAVVDNGTDTVGSIRTYSCNVGTTAGSGSRIIRCQSNFTWTIPMFKCYRQPYFGGYNITESGKPCQRWDARTPNKHGYKSWPNAIDNYCRMYEHSEPWCYTISKDSRWENCNVPLCPTNTDKITAAARLQGTPTGQGIQQQRRSVPSAIIFLIVGMVITLVCLTFLVIAVIILWRRKTVGRKYSDGIKFENAMYVRHTDETSSQQESSGSCKYLSSNIPSSPAYGVFISQLIRYARASNKFSDFILRARSLSDKLLSQGYVCDPLTSSLRKYYGRYGELLIHYDVPLSRMVDDILS